MKNRKWTQWRRFRLRSFEISKGILVHRPTTERTGFTRVFLSLICILGLAFIGPAAAHAGGFKMQQQRRALPYAGPVPAYHSRTGGAYNFNVPNMSTNSLALKGRSTGISTQRGALVLPPNMNQPHVQQIGVPTPARTPLQVFKPQGKMRGFATAGSAKTMGRVSPAPLRNSIAAGSSQVRPGPSSAGAGGRDAAITMGSSQLGSYPSSVGADSRDAAASTGSIGIDPTGQFQQNRRIQGSDQWQGSNYQSFRNYRSEWHDRNWWRSHYSHIVFVAGGWYYWKAGYWYPAWGYDPEAHYAYDGPIYAYNDLPPDQVIANAQAALRPQGYYQAEPDGLLGPVTREAIVNYQRDHGLYETSTIDRPTSESLGMK
jgi:hypothetical protein